jgi:predicted transcriptional regulator
MGVILTNKIYNVNLDYQMIEKIALRIVAYSLAFTCGAGLV